MDSRINIGFGMTVVQNSDEIVFVLSVESPCDWDGVSLVGVTATPYPVPCPLTEVNKKSKDFDDSDAFDVNSTSSKRSMATLMAQIAVEEEIAVHRSEKYFEKQIKKITKYLKLNPTYDVGKAL